MCKNTTQCPRPAGVRFSKDPRTFRARKAIAKSRALRLQSCFIHIFLIWTEVPFIQEVSGAYTSPFLDTDELKLALRPRKVSGAFEKQARGLETGPLEQKTSTLTMRPPRLHTLCCMGRKPLSASHWFKHWRLIILFPAGGYKFQFTNDYQHNRTLSYYDYFLKKENCQNPYYSIT